MEVERPHVDIAELQRISQSANGTLFAAMAHKRVAAEDLVRGAELVIDLRVVSLEFVEAGEVAFKVVVRSVRGNIASAARLHPRLQREQVSGNRIEPVRRNAVARKRIANPVARRVSAGRRRGRKSAIQLRRS